MDSLFPPPNEDQWLPGRHFLPLLEGNQWRIIPFIVVWVLFGGLISIYIFVQLFVPSPRLPLRSEKQFQTIDHAGNLTESEELPCWHDVLAVKVAKAQKEESRQELDLATEIEPAEVLISLVVPAFNEEDRLTGMLEEAVNFLESEYGSTSTSSTSKTSTASTPNGSARSRKPNPSKAQSQPTGWEILLVNDGSTDATLQTCTTFMKNHILPPMPRRASGPWTHRSNAGVRISPGSIRMITLAQNRGKGGAVTHGMRHARGQYILFADADGATNFPDLSKLLSACQKASDPQGRAVAVGSRAHLVGTTATVQRSTLRNFLMYAFHTYLWVITPPATARIRDTQCGFKLFSRQSLPFVIPYMHTEGWIFDVEMLMLAEFEGIPVVEVPVGWREVTGSKLNVVRDSLGMAWGLFVLRVCWATGIYRQ